MSDTNKPNKDESQPAPKPAWSLPDLVHCQVRRSGMSDLLYCLVSDSSRCEYVKHHAYDIFGLFCFHPERREILARTEASR